MDNFNLKKYLAEGRLFEEITPLQQYVLDYEKDISGEVSSNVFQSIKSLESAEDVYDYYANERGWEDDEELKDDLKSIFKQVKNKFGGSELTDLQQRALSYVKKRFGNDEAKKDLDIIKSFKERQDFLDYVYKKVEDENNQSEGRLFEGKLYENDGNIKFINKFNPSQKIIDMYNENPHLKKPLSSLSKYKKIQAIAQLQTHFSTSKDRDMIKKEDRFDSSLADIIEAWADDYYKDSDFFSYGMYVDKDYFDFFNANKDLLLKKYKKQQIPYIKEDGSNY